MKKLLSVLAVLFVMGTTRVFALGIGAQGGYPLGGALTFKLDNKAPVFAVIAHFGEPTGVGITADWWIANPTLAGPIGYFYGIGAIGEMFIGNNWSYLSVGPRVVGGLNFKVLDNFFELYLQAVWQPTFNVDLNGSSGKGGFNFAGFGFAGGFRFWL